MSKTKLIFQPEGLFENLEEKEKKELLANCSNIFSNGSFKKISDEIYTRAVMKTIQGTKEEFDTNQGNIFGIKEFFDTVHGYHMEYLASLKKEESFDKSEII